MLIKCKECELQVSDKATACPHCGFPMQRGVQVKPIRKSNKRRRLPNGFGQISEIKNRNLRKPFRAMVTVGKNSEGRPICKSLKPDTYFETYNEAYAALVDYNKNPYDLDPSITAAEVYEKWSKEYFKTVSSLNYMKAIENAWGYCSVVHGMRVCDIRARHIKSCMEEGVNIIKGVEKHTTSYTKGKIKSMFNLMLDYALEYELVDRNYARSFHLTEETIHELKNSKNGHIPFEDTEIERLWSHVEDNFYVEAMLIQCYSGWRPQELCSLLIENMDLEEWTFQGGMKTDAGKDRIIPIHSKIRELVLDKYNSSVEAGSQFLFVNPETNKPLTYTAYAKGFSKVVKDLNLSTQHRPHDGRTHFVTSAKKYGVDEYAIKYIVGHSISDITEKIYTKRGDRWLHSEIEKIK